MIVKPSLTRSLLLALLVSVITGLVVLITFFKLFFIDEWTLLTWLIIGIYSSIVVISFVFAAFGMKYKIDTDVLRVTKLGKQYVYPYKEMIYIDQTKGENCKTVTIVMKDGKGVYLIHDKSHILYKKLMAKTTNLLSEEEIKKRFPKTPL